MVGNDNVSWNHSKCKYLEDHEETPKESGADCLVGGTVVALGPQQEEPIGHSQGRQEHVKPSGSSDRRFAKSVDQEIKLQHQPSKEIQTTQKVKIIYLG